MMTHPAETLQKVLSDCKNLLNQGVQATTVFDIDSTLLNVSPRTQEILTHFLQNCHEKFAPFPELAQKMNQVSVLPTDWGFDEAFRRLGIPTDPSHSFYQSVKDHWKEKFFSNEFLHRDVPYPGATDFLNELSSMGVHIYYLTGRDQHRMGAGTFESLQDLGFPLDENRAQLILKPHKDHNDAQFKREFFEQFPKQEQTTIWFFENEPVNIYEVLPLGDHIEVIFISSTHSGKASSPTNLPTIKDYLTHPMKD